MLSQPEERTMVVVTVLVVIYGTVFYTHIVGTLFFVTGTYSLSLHPIWYLTTLGTFSSLVPSPSHGVHMALMCPHMVPTC